MKARLLFVFFVVLSLILSGCSQVAEPTVVGTGSQGNAAGSRG